SNLQRQDGDLDPYWFSFYDRPPRPGQLPCYLTYAGEEVKSIVRDHLHQSALYGGAINGLGPRYCPSVEDKVVKFPEAPRHQVFLEPEGLETSEMYVNGLSTSLPQEVQLRFLRAVPGLERVRMTRPGYAIEYDYFPPTQLSPSLEVRQLPGLFFAGQINGTTGYEEAAAQGVVAGLNAAARAQGREPVVLRRDQAFLGVLVDDLVSRGVDEPYRLFTSRAEFRLLLRQDNALRRLLPLAESLRLLSERERRLAHERLEAQDKAAEMARDTAIHPADANPLLRLVDSPEISEPVRISELARRPRVRLMDLLEAVGVTSSLESVECAEIELKYAGYLARERGAAARLTQLEAFRLPDAIPYVNLTTLSYESREKLAKARPATLGQASRIPGVSPSDLQALVLEVLRFEEPTTPESR
ncbi:MAG: FAD-dependent oxidoreductase, partial [Gemmatimonadales bacterium]